MMLDSITKIIKEEREKQGLSYRKLADQVFDDQRQGSLISLIEKNKRPNTSYDVLRKILGGLGYIIDIYKPLK
ncbi:MAG: hypothetical protein ACWA5P_01745 [bacterium]